MCWLQNNRNLEAAAIFLVALSFTIARMRTVILRDKLAFVRLKRHMKIAFNGATTMTADLETDIRAAADAVQ